MVLFSPDDLFLIKGSPNKRRHFLDFILAQIKNDYSYDMDNYVKLLKKRNFLLKKEQTNSKSFQVLEELFTESAARVILARMNFVQNLDEIAAPIFAAINQGKEDLKIRYALSFPIDSGKINLEMVKQGLREELGKNRKQEIRRGGTLVGPHRDNFHIYIGQRLARNFASQGQQRNLAVSLKLAEIEAFFEVKGFYPLFLLDEVLAELDNERRLLLLNYISQSSFQSFMTTVNLNVEERDGKARVCLVRNGALQRRE